MEKANDVTSSCFISSGHGGKQQSLYSCVQALPLSGSTMWGFQQSDGKHKSKAYVCSTPDTWKTASHAVCVAGHTWRQTACAQRVDTQKTVQMLQMSLKLLIIWNPSHLPLAQFGVSVVCKAQQTGSSACWSQSPTVWAEDTSFHKNSKVWCSWIRIFHYSFLSFWLLTETGSEFTWLMVLLVG